MFLILRHICTCLTNIPKRPHDISHLGGRDHEAGDPQQAEGDEVDDQVF